MASGLGQRARKARKICECMRVSAGQTAGVCAYAIAYQDVVVAGNMGDMELKRIPRDKCDGSRMTMRTHGLLASKQPGH